MGNLYSLPSGYQNASLWKEKTKLKEGKILINNEGVEVEIYTITMTDEELKQQLKTYERRKKRPGSWIRILDYYSNGSIACGNSQTFYVITERIKRLAESQCLSEQQAIVAIKQVLILYKGLCNHFGYFQIEEHMIGTSQEGYIKLWVNQNFGSNIPSFNPCDKKQDEMSTVRRLVEIIKNKIPINFQIINSIFNGKQYDNLTIQKAIDVLSNIQLAYKRNVVSEIKSEVSNFTFNPCKKDPEQHVSGANPKNYYYYPSVQKHQIYGNLAERMKLPVYESNPPRSTYNKYKYDYSLPLYQISPIIHTKLTNSKHPETPQQTSKQMLPLAASLQPYRPFRQFDEVDRQSGLNRTLDSTIKQNKNQDQLLVRPSMDVYIQNTVKRQHNQQAKVSQKPVDEVKLVRSHIFVTNQDLYSPYDDLVKQQNIKIEQSRILRRLASQKQSISD